MAIVYCTECGTEMSDQAYACPKCAHPIVRVAPLPQMSMTPPTPFYFSTPAVIVCLLVCPLIGLILMWAGRVWTTGLRAGVTLVYLLFLVGGMFLFFWSVQQSMEQSGEQMQLMIDAVRDIQPPQNFNPERYYEEMERGGYQGYDRYEEPARQITPAPRRAESQIELGLWTWSNQASPEAIRVEGTVKNNATTMFQDLKVYVTAEDANGMLLGVGSALLDPSTLAAGGASKFVVVITGAQCSTSELNITCRFEY